MTEQLHHIRLLAGLEIESGHNIRRTLERAQAEQLAAHLAEDLHRHVPEVDQTLLVCAGAIFEPFELMRPGFPVWKALEDLASSTLRERGFEPGLLSLGAHSGRMPDKALQPPDATVSGQLVALPISLACPADQAEILKHVLESKLFERASLNPPARALLSDQAGLKSVHGHLLTLADLIALQHVQLDSAGLGGFWPVVNDVLTGGDEKHRFDLPVGLKADWLPEQACVEIDFVSVDQHGGSTDDYALWLRAFRTLAALLDAHGIRWQVRCADSLVMDDSYQSLIDAAGNSDEAEGVTVHNHRDIGLVAWTVVEDGHMHHIYPLRPESAHSIMKDLKARGFANFSISRKIHVDTRTGRLAPAVEKPLGHPEDGS